MPHTVLHASNRFWGVSPCGLYSDVIEEIDWSVGKILDALKQQKLDGNTYILFASNNGPRLMKKQDGGSALPLRGGKWKPHLPRPARPPWLGTLVELPHINSRDVIEISSPMLFDLDVDIGEQRDVANRHPTWGNACWRSPNAPARTSEIMTGSAGTCVSSNRWKSGRNGRSSYPLRSGRNTERACHLAVSLC